MADGLRPPDYMSLPKAASLPVRKMNFSYTARRRLLTHGIVSALQLAEIASRSPHQLKELTGISAAKARRLLEVDIGLLPDFQGRAISFDPLPANGVPITANFNGGAQDADLSILKDRVQALTDLPTRVDLSDRISPVGHQGVFPTCVGFATSAVHEFNLRQPMSPGYAYRGAKARDRWHGAGSWQRFAFEHFHRTGHVGEADYPYAAAIREEPIEPVADIAARARASGFAHLPIAERAILPRLIKSVLAGRFSPRLGPLPVAISLVLYPSFTSTSTALDGLISLPLPGERAITGHAMVVTGYVDANDASNPFGIDYFITRNSWGTTWAGENPFGRPGHAMVPTKYLQRDNAITEAIICLT